MLGRVQGGLAEIAEAADINCGLGGEKKRRLRTEGGAEPREMYAHRGVGALWLFVMRGLFAGGIEERVVLFGVED